MGTKNNEIEISIKDLGLVILKKIVVVLIVGCILGGSVGSYKIIRRMKTNDILDISTKLNDEETDIQYELRVQNVNRARVNVEMIDNLNKQIDHQRDYIANSIYMQIDPENVYQSTAQITLTLTNNDLIGLDSALLGAYEREIKAANFLDDYAESIGYKTDYVKELISFYSSESVNTVVNTDDNRVNRISSMYINVYGPSREICDDIMDLVIEEVYQVYDDLNDSIASHSITLVGVQQIHKIDSAVRDNQISHTAVIDSLQKQIVSYNDSLDKVAKQLDLDNKEEVLEYFSEHPFVDDDAIPTNTSEKYVSRLNNIKPGIKWGAIGFCIGSILVIIVLSIKYIFSKRIITQAQFFGLFTSIQNIGVLRPKTKRSKYEKAIDIKTGDDDTFSDDIKNKIISANYFNLTKECEKVLVTGTGDKKAMEDAFKSLKLKGDFKPDMFNNPEVLSSITDYDGIVLLEQRKVSLIKNVENEINLISNGGTPIIGAIII